MDKAAIRTAELNLDYARIRAPFTGRIGRHQAPLGSLVSPAGTFVNTLVQLDPVYVMFNPSELDSDRDRKGARHRQGQSRYPAAR